MNGHYQDQSYQMYRLSQKSTAKLVTIVEELTQSFGPNYYVLPDNSSVEDRNKHKDLKEEALEEAVISIVFQALAVEAYLNTFATLKLGKSQFKKHYDNLNPKSKLIIVTKVVLNKDFPTESVAYNHIVNLFDNRNKLAHSKPLRINNSDSKDDFYYKTEQRDTNLIEGAIETSKTFIEVVNKLKELEGRKRCAVIDAILDDCVITDEQREALHFIGES